MSTSTVLESEVIPNIKEFVGYCETLDVFYNTVLFRGQGYRGQLLLGIARRKPEYNTTD